MALSEFIAEVQTTGIARANRFEATIRFPDALQVAGVLIDKRLRLFCSKVNIPTISYMTFESNTHGETRTAPYQKKFDPISLTFYMDQDFKIKKIFDSWMSYCFDSVTRVARYYDEYAKPCKIDLEVYNVDELIPPYVISFREVYPKAVQEIPLDAGRQDALTLNVVFNYKYYKVNDVDTGLI
jgi:hypothetical protein